MKATLAPSRIILAVLFTVALLFAVVGSFAGEPQGKPTATKTLVPDMVGSVKVDAWRAPWQVALVSAAGNPAAGVFCGGTLIDAQWVLTAAHCLYEDGTCLKIPLQAIFVAHGSTDLGKKVSLIAPAEWVHPKTYKCPGKADDIALIKLAEPVRVASFMLLPSAADVAALTSPGSRLMATGWGLTDPNSSTKSRFLMEAEIPVVGYSQCQTVYGETLPKGSICAGETGKDACSGDSGGPLYRRLQSADKAVQLGVVSFGDGCGKAKTPGVYTAVADHLVWISESRKSKPCTPKDVAENRC